MGKNTVIGRPRLSSSPTELIGIKVPIGLKEEAEEMARKMGLTCSQFIRVILRGFLDSEKASKKQA